jgi:ferric-dicitrate binding protein FerR (iron transport regulator)
VDVAALLARDPAWRPAPAEAAPWLAAAAAPDAPEALRREVRWWRARDAAERADWDAVSALAEEGLAEPFSEREAVRLALLHCVSGSLAEAEHVIAQAVQTSSGEDLPERFASLCAREGLADAAARFRRGPPSR